LVVYPAADLVASNDWDHLIDTITEQIAPTSWSAVGGPAQISHDEQAATLTVRHTWATHVEIFEMFQEMRRNVATQVSRGAPDNAQKEIAKNSADRWLRELDAGNYDICWTQFPVVQEYSTRDEFVARLSAIDRDPKVPWQRQLVSMRISGGILPQYKARCGEMIYATNYRGQVALEVLTVVYRGGQWQVADYAFHTIPQPPSKIVPQS
jgi:hypothetical protein